MPQFSHGSEIHVQYLYMYIHQCWWNTHCLLDCQLCTKYIWGCAINSQNKNRYLKKGNYCTRAGFIRLIVEGWECKDVLIKVDCFCKSIGGSCMSTMSFKTGLNKLLSFNRHKDGFSLFVSANFLFLISLRCNVHYFVITNRQTNKQIR